MLENLSATNIFLIIVGIVSILFIIHWFRRTKQISSQGPARGPVGRPRQTAPPTDPAPSYTLYYFYSPTCGYCRQFMPTWNQLQSALRNNLSLKLKAINASDPENERISFYYNVNQYPTIILVTPGRNIEYVGNRSVGDIVDFLNKYAK